MTAPTTTRPPRSGTPAPGGPRPLRPSNRFQGASVNLLYVPALALFAVFTIYPLLSGVRLSFTNWDGYTPDFAWVGWSNYTRLFTDDTFRSVLVNTFVYGIGSTLIQQVLGLGLALALDSKLRGRNVAKAIIYLPVLVSPIVMGTFYYLLFQYDNGALNDVVVALGGERHAWLSSAASGVALIVVVNSIQFVGTSMIIYLAGLQSISPEYTEAAMLDGANAWQRFWAVTLPLLQPAFATSIILNLIGGLKLFDVIQVLTGGGPGTSTSSVSTLIGTTYFANQAAGYSSAMGVALFVIIAILTVLANTALNRRRLEQS
ncbi:carbohydrate ABC transporter permease [Curtobacterium sp. MMLR14_010]|jgi:raffinose/stachyose/melibiose transport system permease protein|uniref:carbohydrate ABC transporter permease n=1 Tax=Curtobacterium sp. MMLR14_010 TaxID=1898743 RepID=UPI0003927D6A|nr:sugar ABC transporter permease [Curtobacterium sp. MMLR14_010]AGU11912.1 Binding-protein-dependent transport system inner membrane component [uncultured organism]